MKNDSNTVTRTRTRTTTNSEISETEEKLEHIHLDDNFKKTIIFKTEPNMTPISESSDKFKSNSSINKITYTSQKPKIVMHSLNTYVCIFFF